MKRDLFLITWAPLAIAVLVALTTARVATAPVAPADARPHTVFVVLGCATTVWCLRWFVRSLRSTREINGAVARLAATFNRLGSKKKPAPDYSVN